ncbi:MAG: hypothetical protein AAGI08_00215 [Bacteroidota bacterium]
MQVSVTADPGFQERFYGTGQARLEAAAEEVLRALRDEWGLIAATVYMQDGRRGYPEDGPLYRQSERLSEAVLDPEANVDAELTVSSDTGTVVLTQIVRVPYAMTHEKGRSVTVTPAMRNAFYALYKDTGEQKYLAMYLSEKAVFEIPARPYAAPATQDLASSLTALAAPAMGAFARTLGGQP